MNKKEKPNVWDKLKEKSPEELDKIIHTYMKIYGENADNRKALANEKWNSSLTDTPFCLTFSSCEPGSTRQLVVSRVYNSTVNFKVSDRESTITSSTNIGFEDIVILRDVLSQIITDCYMCINK